MMPPFKYGDYVEINIKGQKIKITNGGASHGSSEPKHFYSLNSGTNIEITQENINSLREEFNFLVDELERFVPGKQKKAKQKDYDTVIAVEV
jgi:hypothetical protein